MLYLCSKEDGGVKRKLNLEITEYIIIGVRQARESLIQIFPTQVLVNSIFPTSMAKNLGVTFDSGNTFTSHITMSHVPVTIN